MSNEQTEVGGKKTIYVRAQDARVWETAKAIAERQGTGISTVLLDGLRRWLAAQSVCECGLVMGSSWKFCPDCGKEKKDE